MSFPVVGESPRLQAGEHVNQLARAFLSIGCVDHCTISQIIG